MDCLCKPLEHLLFTFNNKSSYFFYLYKRIRTLLHLCVFALSYMCMCRYVSIDMDIVIGRDAQLILKLIMSSLSHIKEICILKLPHRPMYLYICSGNN